MKQSWTITSQEPQKSWREWPKPDTIFITTNSCPVLEPITTLKEQPNTITPSNEYRNPLLEILILGTLNKHPPRHLALVGTQA